MTARSSRSAPWRYALACGTPFLLLLAGPVPAAADPAPPDSYTAMDEYIRERMTATGTPGLSYAVVGPDGPIHERAWGTDGNGAPVTTETPFLWGSVAKPATATTVMALVDEGRLSLDDPVTDHLPDFRFGGTAHAAGITLHHLLAQTSGLPESATSAVADCTGSDCPRPVHRLSALNDVDPIAPPGAEYAYSSANYLVLAAVVESATGRPFTEHLQAAVLDPAGMDGAVFDRTTARERGLPPGHLPLWGIPAPIATGFDPYGAAYGYLGGDLGDLAGFASLQLRDTTTDGESVLTTDSIELMRHEEQAVDGSGTGYGLGWRVGGLDAPLDDAVWHSGGAPGYSAMVVLLPEQGIALVAQQNLHGLLHDAASMDVFFGAARMLAGAERPADAPSRSTYFLVVGLTSAVAAALVIAAFRAAAALRRPSIAGTPPDRLGVTAVWVAAGAVPWVVGGLLTAVSGLRTVMVWLPDVSVALGIAAVAGAATAALRTAAAINGRAAGKGSSEASSAAAAR